MLTGFQGGLPWVLANHGIEHEGQVRHVSGHRPADGLDGLVEARKSLGHEADGAPEADDAAEGGRDPQGAAQIRPRAEPHLKETV